MKKNYQVFSIINHCKFAFAITLTLAGLISNAQVSVYSFAQLSGTYNPIQVSGPTSTAIAVGTQDDNTYSNLPIGFNFLYNGTSYNSFGVNVNGWINLGSLSPSSSYNPISTGVTNNIISAFGRDLQLGAYQACTTISGSNVITFTYPIAAGFFNVGDTITGTGIPVNTTVTAISSPNMTVSANATANGASINTNGSISYDLSGLAPNRILTVEWKKCGRWSNTSTGLNDFMNFQIKLYETTNLIEVIYGTTGTNNAGTATMEVGLRGNSNTDFNNRSVLSTGSWAASTAGSVNSANGYFSSLVTPVSGQIYRWTPPTGCTGTPSSNSAVTNQSVVCTNGVTSLSLATSYTNTGYTYQWLSSTTGSVGPYTSISGATTAAYSATVSANTWFEAVITCTNGPASTTSTPVQVNVGGNACQCTAYCSSGATSTADEEIFNVSIGTLNNSSTCGQTGGPGSILNEYSNYTGMLAAPSLTIGASYPLSLTAGECSGNSYSAIMAVYIDFNQNGLFTDPGELVYTSPYGSIAVAGTTFTSNVAIPVSATPGITRMRVVLVESNVVSPCGSFSWGETEDYCVYIDPGPPCTSANGGTLTNATYSICNNQPVALTSTSVSLGSGMSYQWMVSTTAGGPYSPVAGGTGSTSPSYTTPPLSATNVFYYVLQASCANASLTGVSNEATVSVNPVPGASVSAVAPICAGQNIVLSSTTNIGTNFTWFGPNSFTSTVQNPTITNAPAGAQGNYTLLVSANNCSATPVTVSVTVNSTNLIIVASPAVICMGNSTTLTAVGNPTTLTWSTGATTNSIVVAPTTNTVYSVAGTGTSNCTANVSSTITVSNPTIAATGATVCGGTTGTLTVNAFAPVSWYATSTPTNALATGNTFTATAVNTTTYYAQAVSSSTNSLFTTLAAGNGFSGNMFDVVALNNIEVNGFDMHFSSTGTATVEVWYRSGSFVGFETSNAGWTMAYTSTATALGTGSLSIIPGSFTVSIPAGQTYGFYVTALSTGPQVNYTNGTLLGNTYVQNADAKILEGKGGGYFNVINNPRVFNGKMRYSKAGCTSPIVPVVLTVSSQSSITATAGSGTVCAGGSTGLTASGASTYTWNNGATGAIIAVTPSITTTYTVTGNVGGGCTGTATVAVAVNPLPTVSIVASQTTVCTNGSTVALTGSPAGGAYTGSNVTAGVFTPGSASGTFVPGYAYTSPSTGCSNSASVTIIVTSCTSISKLYEKSNTLQVYPNPNTGIFTLELINGEVKNIQVSDLTGRIILSDKTSQDKMNVNISGYANGIYFVKIQSIDFVETIRIIKQ